MYLYNRRPMAIFTIIFDTEQCVSSSIINHCINEAATKKQSSCVPPSSNVQR